MKRRAVKRAVVVGVLLLAGAVCSVGVAWGIVIWHEFHKDGPAREISFAIAMGSAESDEMFTGGIDSYFGMTVCTGIRMAYRKMPKHYLPSDPGFPGWFEPPAAGIGETRATLAAGFPLLCMKLEMDYGTNRTPRYSGALDLPFLREVPVVKVPLRPMYGRLFINSLVYAGGMFLVFRGARALRQHQRLRRGRCEFCGYDLVGDYSRACSECGHGGLVPEGKP